MSSTETISNLYNNPSLLIPPLLHKPISPVKDLSATTFQIWFGRADRDYIPSLPVLFFQPGGMDYAHEKQEIGTDHWSRTLNSHRLSAIEQKKMDFGDYVIASLLAHECPPYSMKIISFIIAQKVRGLGIGKDFLNHFTHLFGESGLKFLWQIKDFQNLDYPGFYRSDQLQSNLPEDNGEPILPVHIPVHSLAKGRALINFLDKGWERECVKPEFLRL